MSENSLRGKSTVKFPSDIRPYERMVLALLGLLLSITHAWAAQPAPALVSAIIERINQNYRNFPGIKAYLELELSQPGISPHRSFAQLAFLSEGERLYFKTFSPLTPHYFTLISKGKTFWLQIPKTKTIFTGPLEAIGQENFELKITPQDFRRILITNPVEQTPDRIQTEEEAQHWILTLYGETGAQTFKDRVLRVQKTDLRVVKDTRFSVTGNPYLEIQWTGFGVKGRPFGPPPARGMRPRAGTASEPRLEAVASAAVNSITGSGSFSSGITLFKPPTGYLLRLSLKNWEVTGRTPAELFEIADQEAYSVEKINP